MVSRSFGVEAFLLFFLVVVAEGVLCSASLTNAAEWVNLPMGEAKVFSIAISSDGKYLAGGTGGSSPTTKLFDATSHKELFDIPCMGRGAAFALAFDASGKQLAIADYNLAVTIRSVPDGAEIAELPGDSTRKKYRQARKLSFLPSGKRVAVGYSTGEVFVWEISDKSIITKFDHGNEITALSVSPDGQTIATGTDFGLRVWKTSDGSLIGQSDRKSSGEFQVKAIAYTNNGEFIVTADQPGYVRVFEIKSNKELRSFKMPAVGSETTIVGLGLNSDDKTIVVPGMLQGIDSARPRALMTGLILLDFETTRPKGFVESDSCRIFALHHSGKYAAIATGDTGDPIQLINMTKARPVK